MAQNVSELTECLLRLSRKSEREEHKAWVLLFGGVLISLAGTVLPTMGRSVPQQWLAGIGLVFQIGGWFWLLVTYVKYGRLTTAIREQLKVLVDEGIRSSEIENGERLCSEAAIRALATGLRHHLPRAEAWQKLKTYYYENACADEVDVDRFEEISIKAFAQEQDGK